LVDVEGSPKMRSDLSDLRLFLNVVEAGSITRGAERMHLALAAASLNDAINSAAIGHFARLLIPIRRN
jgi:Bacterial regulatory helix-turn-helix protein, lysR family